MARKKKIKLEKVDLGPKEYEGWTVGDSIWFPSRYEATPRLGEIVAFYPNDKTAPCASVYDLTMGGQRVIPIQYLFEDKKKAKQSRQSYLDFLLNLGENK